MITKRLPVVPKSLLARYNVRESSDDRFRACARLLQALWREDQNLPIGEHEARDGVLRKMGSRIADGASSGRNFLLPVIAQLAWQEAVYREPGAVIDEDRLWSNLLSSQPLTFNVMGPMRLDFDQAASFLATMSSDLKDVTVTEVLFEHSPGRGDPTLTGDSTAFDALIRYQRPDGCKGFVAFEFKYSESCRERSGGIGVSCQAAMIASNLFVDSCATELQTAPLQQLTREHTLAQASVSRGDYAEGSFVVVAPELNAGVRSACELYSTHLVRPAEGHVDFQVWTLEAVVGALRKIGDISYSEALQSRYLDWDMVEKAIEATRPFLSMAAPSRDRRKRA